jgi:hypothetical protein
VTFAYYRRLTEPDKRIYRASDAVVTLNVPHAEQLQEGLRRLSLVLQKGDQAQTQKFTDWFVRALTQLFKVPNVRVKVLARRPSDDWGELHGLYEPANGPSDPAVITVWMRTAKRKDVVAFKTFLRTVIHEVCHHLDYTHLKLADSFHTAGFYKRESSLMQQLMA